MPPLKRPPRPETIDLPPRQGIDAGETDVLVVGGGPSGLGAVIGAASAGAGVILAERYGFLGGNATAALVAPLASWRTEHPRPEQRGVASLSPTNHGQGNPTIGGALSLLVDSLVAARGAIPPSSKTGYVVPFDPEVFKMVALDLVEQAGAQFLLHAFASTVLGTGRVQGVVFETKSGPIVIRCKTVIDCTGDGDVAARAGARYEIGRQEDGMVQPMTLMFTIAAFDHEAFAAYARLHPDQWRGVHGLWDLVRRATEAGELDLPREDILFFATPHENEVSVNSTRVVNVLGTDIWDLTYAEWQGRRQMRQIAAFLRKYVPGFDKSYVLRSGMTMGVRETRRIVGEYVLTGDDVLGARKFHDVIAQGAYPIDIHNPSGRGTVLKRVPPGQAYDIPLRCLIPRELENVLVAGRCISGTHEALSSYRVMPISMATGQAAGVCAALSVRYGLPPRLVPATGVQDELRRQGAVLTR
jgi:glycine/D-amino acid oxidase-like deaminating enzyme